MANTIRIKRRASNSNLGSALPTGLYNAELAFNEVNNTLYIGRGGDATGVNANATSTVVAGDGVVWTGTQTFGTVNAGGGVYAYKDTYPVDPKLLATVEYVDDAISRGAGATLYPHAANADCATTSSLLTAAPFDKLQSFDDVRIAWAPTTLASYSETFPLSGAKTLQGVTLANGNRVLLLNHLQPGFKGIWVVNTSGAWTRATGADYAPFYTAGKRVKVTEGTNANKIYEIAAPADRPTNENTRTFSSLTFNITTSQPVTSATAQYQRVVRAAADVYTVENNKIKVDGVVLEDGDRFLWMPQFGGDGGATPSDMFDSGSPQATGGIYRVNYAAVTTSGSAYAAAVRDQDLFTSAQFQAANTTKVLVREGTANKQKIYTISAATPFTVGTTVPTFTHSSTYSSSAQGFQGTPIIDGYQTQVENLGSNQIGSAVLVKDEVDATYNGLYYIPALSGSFTTANVPWIRHPTADAAGELVYGSYIRVLNGSVNKNLAFVQIGEGGEDKIITPSNEVPAGSGTTSAANNNPDLIVFQSAQASSDIVAGVGLAKANRTLYVKTASSSRITVTEAGVDLATMAPNPSTDGLSASTAYILTHVDAYGRVTDNSSTTITATDFRNKLSSLTADDTSTGTGNVVFSDSPALTGTPTAPSPDANDDSTKIATTAWVTDALATGGGAQLLAADNTWTGANIFRKTTGTRFEQANGQAAVIVAGGAASSGNFTTTISPTNASPGTGSGAVAALTANRTITLPDASTTLVGFDTTQTLSNKTLSAPKMTGTHIADTNGNELIVFPAVVASAVNEITVTNAATGTGPQIQATGGDTNIALRLTPKGTGAVTVTSTQSASSTTTGAFVVSGGAGIAGDLYVGASIRPRAGAAAAGAAPIYLQSGTNLTAAVAGAVEWNGTNLFITDSTPTRKTVAFTDSTMSGNTTGTAASWTNSRDVTFATGDTTGSFSIKGDANVTNVALTTRPGTTTATGIVQLEDATNSTSTTRAATPNSVKSAYDLANAALPKSGGTMTGAISFWASQTWPTFNQSTTGNAATATKLATAVNINGVSFDGSGNITVADSTKLPLAGGTMTGKLTTVTSTTSTAAVNVPSGVAPTTPASGDFWNESGALKFNNGATKTIAYTDSTITGNAAGLSSTLVATSGGTGQSAYNMGEFLYAATTNPSSLTKLAKASSGTVGALIQDGTTGVPSWQTVTGNGNVVRATSPQLTTSVTTDSTTFTLLNTTATTINAFGAATNITIGATSAATTTIQSTQASTNSTTGALVVSGGLGVASASFFGGNITAAGDGAISGNLTVTGNLIINGTTTTVNTNTLTVEDKNIEIGNAPTILNVSGSVGSSVPQMTVTSTNGMMVGQILTYVSGVGQIAAGSRIASVDSATQITLNQNATSPGPIVVNVSGANDFTAIGGGISVKGVSDKTFQITTSNSLNAALFNFTSSEHLNVASGKTYKINDVEVLSATTLGSSVVNSSLTSVGVLTGGQLGVGFTTVAVARGGTGASTFTTGGIIFGSGQAALQATAAGTQYQVLRAGSGGTPAFGAINLDQSAAVTGTLPVGNGGTGATTLTGIVKGNGTSALSAATAGTDYLAPPSGTALLKANSGGALANATAGTDYVAPSTTTVGKIITQAAASGAASLLITPQSATPTTLAAGDLWNDAGTLKFRQTSATKDIAFTDSNITGTAAGLSATLVATSGGTGQSTYAIGDLLYASSTTALTKLSGNTTTTRRVLTQTGTGSASAAPSWVNQCDIVADCAIDGGTF